MGINTDVWKALEVLKTPRGEQTKRTIQKIVTHEFPDMDCLYSIYLLRKFGEKQYDEIRNAELIFVPAGTRYLGKKGKELLEEEIITLDLEGGYFDHHSPAGSDAEKRCTAFLVAKELGVAKDQNIQKMLKFIDKNDIKGIGVQSKEPADHLIALPNLLKGLNLRYDRDYQKVYFLCEELFEAAYWHEIHWFQALDDIKQGHKFMINDQFKILSFKSESILSAKAGRYKQGSLCIIEGKNRSLNLISRRNKQWPQPDFTKVAKVIRLAEALRLGLSVNNDDLGNVGTVVDWFLHDSLSFLSRGSFKKSDAPPSSLTLEEIFNLTIFCFLPEKKYLGSLDKYYDDFKLVLGEHVFLESLDKDCSEKQKK